MSNKWQLSTAQKSKIYEEKIFLQITNVARSRYVSPKAYILGGQPGSGKSHLITKLKKTFDDEVVVINGDELRAYHPHYNFLLHNDELNASDLTQLDVNYWIERMIADSAHRKKNMIIEGTMKNSKVPIETAHLLEEYNYTSEAYLLIVPPAISLTRINFRYESLKRLIGSSRFTKKAAHDFAVEKIPNAITEIAATDKFNSISIYFEIKGKIQIVHYQAELPISNNFFPYELTSNEYERKLNQFELNYIERTWRVILKLAKERGVGRSYYNDLVVLKGELLKNKQ